MGYEGVDWIGLAQCRVQWLAFLNAVMQLRVLFKFLPARPLIVHKKQHGIVKWLLK